jgi:hypothetical protein
MLNSALTDAVPARVLSAVLTPAHDVGGEIDSQPRRIEGRGWLSHWTR